MADTRVATNQPCRPYVCPFPEPANHCWRDRWTCPNCGAEYRLTARKPERPWRNWSAPHGYWRLAFRSALHWGYR